MAMISDIGFFISIIRDVIGLLKKSKRNNEAKALAKLVKNLEEKKTVTREEIRIMIGEELNKSLEPPSAEGLSDYLDKLISKPVEDEYITSPKSKSDFITLEPYEKEAFTTKLDATGAKELQLSLKIDGKYPYYSSHFMVRSVRKEGFLRGIYEDCGEISIRVGSSHSKFIRGSCRIPIGENSIEVEVPLVPEQGWHIGETKQFFATTGPNVDPIRFSSAPLTVKRIR